MTSRFRPTGQPAADYSVQVKGLSGTTGAVPGRLLSAGRRRPARARSHKPTFKRSRKINGMTAENSSYNFDADVNRDGVINSQDVKIAKEDLGVRPRSARSSR